MWLCEGNVFTMGGDESDARPRFSTEVASFYLGKSVVTNDEYEVYDPHHERSASSPGDRDPVVRVSFREALGYSAWYSRESGKAFRLPTEREWEFACRAGTSTPAFWGDGDAEPFVWDLDNSGGRGHAVESRRANPFGLHDLLGLVWEWTSSLFHPYPVVTGDGRDDPRITGPRVVRGGSFREPRRALGSAVRRALLEDARLDDLGFRIARSL